MTRIAAALVTTAAVMMALGGGSAAAADTCPNAAYRAGAGAKLPECRAWEQVTPVDKRGYQADPESFVFAGPDGGHVYFNEKAGVADADSAPAIAAFTSVRGSAWSTLGVDPPLDLQPDVFTTNQGVRGISDDRSKALVVSLRKLTPDAVEGASNVYVRDTRSGAYTLYATQPGTALYVAATTDGGGGQFFFGASSDFQSVGITSSIALSPDSSSSQPNLFVLRKGDVSLASRDVDGTPLAAGGDAAYRPFRISQDQRRVTFNASRANEPQGLFQRVDGTSTVLISRSHRDGVSNTDVVETGSGWPTADGTRVTFQTGIPRQLTNDDEVSPFYRWTANGDQLENLLAGVSVPWSSSAGVFQLLKVSSDQRYLWFTYTDRDSNSRAFNVLALLDTATKRVSIETSSEADPATDPTGAGSTFRFSPDGTKLVLGSIASLTGYDQAAAGCPEGLGGRCAEAFLFDAGRPDATPVCISCGAPGTESVAPVGLGDAFSKVGFPAAPELVTDEGRVVFDTPQRLAGGDVNSLSDVYEYDPARGVTLMSGGSGDFSAVAAGITPSGNDVLFRTANALVPQDTDVVSDLYDARVGGGLASQQVAPVSPVRCPTGDCLGATVAPPAAEASRTAGFRALPAPPVFAVSRVSASARRSAARTGRLALSVRVGAAGKVSGRATARVGRRSRVIASSALPARRAGRYTLTLALSRSARRALAREGSLKLAVSVSYSRAASSLRQSVELSAPRGSRAAKGGAR